MPKSKVQTNIKVQNIKLLKFGFCIWFGIWALTFDIASQEEIYGIRIQIS
jgi:hypothetical protein